MSRLKDRICISYLLVLYLNLLQCCIVEMYITSFTLLPLFRTLCLFINRPTLTSYIRKYKFSIFLPWKCSICFCFIACHNSLFPLLPWTFFLYGYDSHLFDHASLRTIYYWYFPMFCSDSTIVRISYTLFLYPTLTFNVSLHFENTSKRQVNICLLYTSDAADE